MFDRFCLFVVSKVPPAGRNKRIAKYSLSLSLSRKYIAIEIGLKPQPFCCPQNQNQTPSRAHKQI